MQSAAMPYSLPETLEPDLARVLDYWKRLRRGEADMPFADDVDLTKLPDLADRTVLVTVFEPPERFRFEQAGAHVAQLYGSAIAGEFSDELERRPPLEDFTEQAKATVSRRAPTYARFGGHARILLPTWGDGHIAMLLGAVADPSG